MKNEYVFRGNEKTKIITLDELREYNGTRIIGEIPKDGKIILSREGNTVIIYSEECGRLTKAMFDVAIGQPVPDESQPFELNGFRPATELETRYFVGAYLQHKNKPLDYDDNAVGFLESLLEILDAPVVEIGKSDGDSCNRYFAFRKYQIAR